MENETRTIIERLDRGDRDAFRALVSCWENKVLAIVTSYFSRFEEVEDLCQETFLRVYKGLGTYDRNVPFGPWVGKIAVNLCRDSLRRKKKERNHPFIAYSSQEADFIERALNNQNSFNQTHRLNAEQARALVEKLLTLLPKKHRMVLTLKEYMGWTDKEIADLLGCSENSVAVQAHRARAKLRKILAKEARKIALSGEK
ncbi:RNA polymerase sigma factor [Acidobacteriota bacterium]